MKRLREPSTYASIAAMLAIFGIDVGPGAVETVMQIGAGVAAVLGIALSEKDERLDKD